MQKNKNIFCFGLGVSPKSIFGTTKNLKKNFGDYRVLIHQHEKRNDWNWNGMALNGKIPIMIHQRLDFSVSCESVSK